MNTEQSTIYAVSSGSGRAGVAVLRVSGPAVQTVLKAVAGGVPTARHAVLRRLRDPAGELLDEALVLYFPGPHSVTGEDVAEFHLHGSAAVVAAVLRVLGDMPDLDMAEAGAFTRRAFINGKMDLVEVEGLADVLAANSDSQRRLALRQMTGATSLTFERWRDELVGALAMVEAAVDFIDEDGVAEQALLAIRPRIDSLAKQLQSALALAGRASALRDGVRVVIAGPPNAGKSSLINWLTQRDVAIVSPIAGTTRDVVEAPVSIAGFPLVLSDTAGLRGDTHDPIEAIGMARARREIGAADILIWVTAPDCDAVAPPRAPDIRILNKVDLVDGSIQGRNDCLMVSLKSGTGLDEMIRQLTVLLQQYQVASEDAVVVRARHVQAVTEALNHLQFINDSREAPLEITAEHLRAAARHLAQITGRVDVEDLLGRIFSEFCVGK
jgi:tRNA modification GTPase